MATTKECPVCGSDMSVEVGYMDHILMEEHCECSKCGKFRYEYVTGNTRIIVGDTELSIWHGANAEEQRQFEANLKTQCEIVERQVNHGSH